MKRILGSIIFFIIVMIITAFVLDYFNLIDADFFTENIHLVYTLLIIAYVINLIAIIGMIMVERGHPVKTLAWLIGILLLPFVGIILYLFFGFNYRKEKLFSRKGLMVISKIKDIKERQLEKIKSGDIRIEDVDDTTRFDVEKNILLCLNNVHALYSNNNKVKFFHHGEETFEAMFEAIEKAEHHIHVEYYIIGNDRIGNRLKDLLIRKAKEGVEVRVIYDDVGSWDIDDDYLKPLQEAGVQSHSFMPVRFPNLTSNFNYRNHRKIIVIDGKVGFTGGVNLSEEYADGHPEMGFWRDTHIRFEGDAVKSLQSVFFTDWYFVSKDYIEEQDIYFPKLETAPGDKLMQIVSSGPDSDYANIMQMYFNAINSAKRRILMVTPYFIPNESILTALKTAALSGIDIHILMPDESDSQIVRHASNSYLEDLLATGIKVSQYQKGFIHAKLLIVDDIFVSVGTANMDIRSFEYNFEVNAIIYDKEVASQLVRQFEKDLRVSMTIELGIFKKRSVRHKFYEGAARLVAPLL